MSVKTDPIQSKSQEMSTAYVGISTPEGTCEAVEVAISKPANQAKQNRPKDEFFLIGALTGGARSPHPGACFAGVVLLSSLTLAQKTLYVNLPIDSFRAVHDGKIPDELKYHGLILIGNEGLLGAFTTMFFDSLKEAHRFFWTPVGLKELARRVYDVCGQPGGGLKDKMQDWWEAPVRTPELRTVHFDFKFPDISPEAIRNTAAATATAIVIGAMIVLAPAGI